MTFVSLTRLRIRSIRFLPFFAVYAVRSRMQVQKSAGFKVDALLADRGFTFWTLTAWDSEEDMRAFMISGAHKSAMPYLMRWCDEASVAHWTQPDTIDPILPTWAEADRRMRETGRPSKVLHPSPEHADLNYRPPRTAVAAPVRSS